MNTRQKDGIVAIISGLLTVTAGFVAVFSPVDPAWLAPVVASIGAVVTVIFGVKISKG